MSQLRLLFTTADGQEHVLEVDQAVIVTFVAGAVNVQVIGLDNQLAQALAVAGAQHLEAERVQRLQRHFMN